MNFKKYLAYTRAYTGHFDWPVVLFLRKPVYKQMSFETSQILAKGLVLDLGTGPAHLPIEIARNFQNVQVVGVDISLDILKDAYKKARTYKIESRISLIQASAEFLPFTDNVFEAVQCMFSLHQWHNKQLGIAEIYRVLKPGGQAIILVGKQYFLRGLLRWFYFWTNRPISEIRNICLEAGINNVKITPLKNVNGGLRILIGK